MPPKKKKEKKSDEEEALSGERVAEAMQLTEVDFLMLMDDMSTLREKLDRTETRCSELEAKNTELEAQLDKHKGDQKDIYMYMKRLDVKKDNRIGELEDEHADLEQEKEDMQTIYESKLYAERNMRQDREKEMSEEIDSLKKKFAELNEFMTKKEEIERELEITKSTLHIERKDTEQKINDLERKNVQEKDKLKKDMLWKIKETKANLLKLTDNQLEITTKRTIMENEQMSSELAYQSKQTEKLIQANDKLMQENRDLRRNQELHRATEEDLVKKNHVYQKTIKAIMEKIKVLEAEKDEASELKEVLDRGFVEEREKANEMIRNLEDDVANIERQEEKTQRELEAVRDEYTELKEEYRRYMGLQDEATRFILSTLEDAKAQLSVQRKAEEGVSAEKEDPWNPQESVPSALDSLSTAERERVLRYLFVKLSSFGSMQGPGSSAPVVDQQGRIETPFVLPPISNTPRGLTAGSIGTSGIASAVHTPMGPVNMGLPGDQMAFGVAQVSQAVQTASDRVVYRDENKSTSPEPFVAIPVNGPVRPWGKRSKELPLTVRNQDTFLRKHSYKPSRYV